MRSHASCHCLYITYDGLLDPLGQSQILPYIFGLAENGFRFTILSFEKMDRDPRLISHLAAQLQSKNIAWVCLPFVHGRFQGLLRIIRGVFAVQRIAKRESFSLAHIRTIVPAVIYRLRLSIRPLIYDIRAFSGQWVDGRRLIAHSLSYLFLSRLDNWLIRNAAGLVVLDRSGFDHLCENFKNLPPVKVIPTSTDLKLSSIARDVVGVQPLTKVRFVCLGGARFPYLPLEALEFVQALLAFGYDCSVDFINSETMLLLSKLVNALPFPVTASSCSLCLKRRFTQD